MSTSGSEYTVSEAIKTARALKIRISMSLLPFFINAAMHSMINKTKAHRDEVYITVFIVAVLTLFVLFRR